jgi:predicted DNA binding CopG/RHH family protein
MHNREKVNINLALSKQLLDQIKNEADLQEISYSALIRLILQAYLDNKYGTKTKSTEKDMGNL